MKNLLPLLAAVALSACASVSAIPLSANSFQVMSNGNSGCTPEQAQKVAFRHAAVETIRRGHDRFIITGSDGRSQMSSASVWGGSASYGHNEIQTLTVKTFKADDPAAADAISARETLGPKWEEAIKEDGPVSCA